MTAVLEPKTSRRAIDRPVPTLRSPDGSNSQPTTQPPMPTATASAAPTSPALSYNATPSGASARTQTTGGQHDDDAHRAFAAGSDVGLDSTAAKGDSKPNLPTTLLDPDLRITAQLLNYLEHTRKQYQNRLRQFTRGGPDDERILKKKSKFKRVEDLPPDADEKKRGWALPLKHPLCRMLAETVDDLKRHEHQAELALCRIYRKHPLRAYTVKWKGVGDKQAARLVAILGDPYINLRTGLPRTVGQLWKYCGSDVREGKRPRHRQGVQSNWSSKANSATWNIAVSCLKAIDSACRDAGYPHVGRGGHVPRDTPVESAAPACTCSTYRVFYDQRRAHTAVTHGPKSEVPWTDGHSHNDALGVTAKEVLKDLWRAARDWHLAQQAGAE